MVDADSGHISLRTKIVRTLVHTFAMFRRAMTLGVRIAVFNQDGEILLVKHTYLKGWYLPGGGVDPGETLEQAAIRELREEAGIVPVTPPQFLSMHFNRNATQRDHVAFFVVRDWNRDPHWQMPGHEIAEVGFFSPESLPQGTTPATRRRLMEVRNAQDASAFW
ncbi:NUDIX domain-containing protein [Pseudovibrio exalbescens]|uniref:NUDIX domain-containing protein n=1 Tax=Pseudovibrio exalbescens TaxID=197461 RepID=UPI0023659231|nr:NUDIX domain-containing protein [Pseudovibrio exalbescens]MDD7910156.1 NUDIX domain-containing protein [Pseudovibrio exalbescens]